jgi:hypothetical protein
MGMWNAPTSLRGVGQEVRFRPEADSRERRLCVTLGHGSRLGFLPHPDDLFFGNRFDFIVRSHQGGLYSWAVFAGVTSVLGQRPSTVLDRRQRTPVGAGQSASYGAAPA